MSGDTPLLGLHFRDEGVTVFAKAEFLNPSGSIKDRLAHAVFEDLARSGRLAHAVRIVEVSNGNTGIALAARGAALGVPVHVLMSDTTAPEFRDLVVQCGAKVTLFRADRGYLTGIALAEEMAAADPAVFLPRQFESRRFAEDHRHRLAREIVAQVPDRPIDAFVAGYGTGSTLLGCGAGLREHHPGIVLVAVEIQGGFGPSTEMPCNQWIDGMSGGFLPPLLRAASVDAVTAVTTHEALAMTRRLAREFGLLVGPSSGAGVVAALRTAQSLGPDACIVTILWDRADRYLHTGLFDLELQ
jgi:cysteine synthase A